jgi:hypothetical protein
MRKLILKNHILPVVVFNRMRIHGLWLWGSAAEASALGVWNASRHHLVGSLQVAKLVHSGAA